MEVLIGLLIGAAAGALIAVVTWAVGLGKL